MLKFPTKITNAEAYILAEKDSILNFLKGLESSSRSSYSSS